MIAGPGNVYICDECVDICADIIEEEYEEETEAGEMEINLLKPVQIKQFLDDYVIGQEEAKKVLPNRFRQDLSGTDACQDHQCAVCDRGRNNAHRGRICR